MGRKRKKGCMCECLAAENMEKCLEASSSLITIAEILCSYVSFCVPSLYPSHCMINFHLNFSSTFKKEGKG